MAASEANFFASAPIFLHHLKQLQTGGKSSRPVDLIINAFTLTGVALLCGEVMSIPVAGFCLQPTCIPSDDKDWHAIIPVNGGGLSLIEKARVACGQWPPPSPVMAAPVPQLLPLQS